MLSVTNKGETCSNNLCQHPQCWQTKVRLVRQAVLGRNGIKNKKERHAETRQSLHEERSRSLPTLKIVDVTRQLVSSDDDSDDNDDQYKSRQHSCQQLLSTSRRSQNSVRNHTPSSYSTHGPNPTPVSLSSTDHKKEHKDIKEKQCCARTKDHDKTRKLNKINFHEVYDQNEIYGDWNDTFVSTAYLVWCPSTKKKKRTEDVASPVENQTNGYKNIIDEVLPIPDTTETPKKRTHKYPTGGQPYTPCRSPLTRQEWYKPVDYYSDGDYIMTVATENVPPSLVTSKKVLEVKENARKKDVQFLDESNSTKVLVDISAHLSRSQILSEKISIEDKNDEMATTTVVEEVGQDVSEESSGNTDEKLTRRKAMRLPSVGIPWDLLPKSPKIKHCRNSIPHDKDLGVIMEPVVYLPRSGTNKEHTDTTMDVVTDETLLSKESVDVLKSLDQFDERDHLTSAYRFSPTNVSAPAPTPNTPQMRQRSLKSLMRKQGEKASRTMLADRSLDTICQESYEGKVLGEHVPSDERILQDVHEVNTLVIDHDIEEGSHTVNASTTCEKSRAKLGKFISEKHAYDLDASFSMRAVSPSSRTNIPPDIWAELQANVLDDLKPRITRGYRNSLAVSGYTYDESAFWKTSGTRLPKSFNSHRCSLGVSSQNILPQMPASLTVVPVPSIRKGKVRSATPQRRHTYAAESPKITNIDDIKIPVVPIASPAPTEVMDQPVIGVNQEEEYIVAHDVVSPSEDQMDTMLEKASYEDILFHLTTTDESTAFSFEDTGHLVVSDQQKEYSQQISHENNQILVAPERSYAIIEPCDGIADDNKGMSLECGVMVQDSEDVILSTEESSGLLISQPDGIKVETSDTSENPVEATTTTDISVQSHQDSATTSDHDTSKQASSKRTSDEVNGSTDTSVSNQLTVNANLSSGTSGSLIGTSSESMLAKVPSEAPLEIFNIESNLLLPVAIESDLLLLTESFLDLSFADDNLSDTADNIDGG